MGTKETKSTTEIPPKTTEELQQIALLNGMIDAELSKDYDKQTTSSYIYKRQADIDQIQKEVDAGTLDSRRAQGMINKLKEEGGQTQYQTVFSEKPEVKARRLRQEAASDKVEEGFFKAAEKLTSGDYSVSPQTRAQIDALIGDNFSSVIDELKANFSSSETAVNDALKALVDAGKTDIANSAVQQRNALKQSSEMLGRSFSDSDMQSRMQEFEQGQMNSLYQNVGAQGAAQIANLRNQSALAIGNVRNQEAQTRLGLLTQAAQPLTAFNSGSSYAQLQGALRAQGLQNTQVLGGMLQNNINTGMAERAAQPTTTQQTPWGVLDVLGALGGAAGATFSGMGAFKK